MLSMLCMSAICYISGVYICDFFGADRTYELIAAAVFSACIFLLVLRTRRHRIFVGALFFCIGILAFNISGNLKYNSFYPLCEKYVNIEGYVCDIPVQNGDIISYNIKTTRMEYLGREYKVGQVIKMTSREQLSFGAVVSASGFLKEISEKKNSTDFDVKRYYQSRGINYKIYATELSLTDEVPENVGFSYHVNALKNRISKCLDENVSEKRSAVLKAVLLGNKHYFSDDFRAVLINTGIMRFFYPSYFHIYLLSALCAGIFAGLKKAHRDYILVFVLLIYAALNCYSPVFLKNILAAVVTVFMIKRLGFSHYPDVLSITLLAVCLLNPLYCFDVGIIMSSATGLLFYYFKDILYGAFSFIPFKAIRRVLVFYIITTIGLMPLASVYFNGIALYSGLLTPIYLVVTAGLIAAVPLGLIFNALFGSMFFLERIIASLCSYFEVLPYFIQKLPFSTLLIKPCDVSFILAFYLTLATCYRIAVGEHKSVRTRIYATAASGLWCSVLLVHFSTLGNLYISFVNVGQGDACVVSVKGGETILIDGGGGTEFSDYDAGEKVFYPYLADNGYFTIDKAIVSHYHRDHCLGIISAMKNLTVKEVIMPDCNADNPYRAEIEAIAGEKDIKLTYARAGDEFLSGSGLKLTVLSPGEEELLSGDENEVSIVLKLEYNDFSCLFTGDIGSVTEQKLLGEVGKCEVVKMAHHGSAKSNSAEFASELSAEFAIASVGENNMYDFPTREAVYNYQQAGTKVLRTDKNGNITVRVDRKGHFKVYKGAENGGI